MVYIVTYHEEICFVADNEYDALEYLNIEPSCDYTHDKFKSEMGIDVHDWLDDGHIVDEITEFLDGDFKVDHYSLGYCYKCGSPFYMKKIIN